MPLYNKEAYLQQTLDSVLGQSYRKWELNIIDDGSTDASSHIAKTYQKKDTRIKYFFQEHQGIHLALNRGWREAKGEILGRLDADDLYPVSRTEKMVNALCQTKKKLVTGQVVYFSEGILGEGYKRYASWLNSLSSQKDMEENLFIECVIPSPAWLMWRKDFICLSSNINHYPEDYDFCFKVFEQKNSIVKIPECVLGWRDYSERTSRTHKNYSDQSFWHLKARYLKKKCIH